MNDFSAVTSQYDVIGTFCQEQRHQSDVSWATGLAALGFFAALRRVFAGGISFRYDR